jgi:uncharacterized membrane protein YbhN (UPF0104 family)
MIADLLLALLALAALFVPLGFAWWVLSRTARRHAHRRKGGPMR